MQRRLGIYITSQDEPKGLDLTHSILSFTVLFTLHKRRQTEMAKWSHNCQGLPIHTQIYDTSLLRMSPSFSNTLRKQDKMLSNSACQFLSCTLRAHSPGLQFSSHNKNEQKGHETSFLSDKLYKHFIVRVNATIGLLATELRK